MTNILLSIIILLLIARIGLQIAKARRAVGKSYATADEVENVVIIVENHRVDTVISDYGKLGYEFVQAICPCGGYGASRTQIFFTKKKIRTKFDK